jgi:hypothetical protein
MNEGPNIWMILSFAVAAGAALVAGGIVFFIMSGQLKAPFGEDPEKESMLDRFGIACFRVANRFVISTFGGAVLISLFRVVARQPKRRRA